MNTFEQDRAAKLKNKPFLRIFNALGMVAWRKDRYEQAEQCLRLLHPLSWAWFLIVATFGVLAYGVPTTKKEMQYNIKNETVWW